MLRAGLLNCIFVLFLFQFYIFFCGLSFLFIIYWLIFLFYLTLFNFSHLWHKSTRQQEEHSHMKNLLTLHSHILFCFVFLWLRFLDFIFTDFIYEHNFLAYYFNVYPVYSYYIFVYLLVIMWILRPSGYYSS